MAPLNTLDSLVGTMLMWGSVKPHSMLKLSGLTQLAAVDDDELFVKCLDLEPKSVPS